MDGVWGTVNYLAPGSVRNRLYVAPGDQRATARYEPHQVFVADGRPRRDDLTLDAAGFTLLQSPDRRRRPRQPGRARRRLHRRGTRPGPRAHRGGLRRFARLADAPHHGRPGGALPPAPDVHVDLHSTEIAHRYARVHARVPLPAPGTYRRAVWTSLWRAFSPPPQDWPLAVCDYRSTDDAEDGTPNLLFRVPALPDPGDAGRRDADAESAASLFFSNPAHRWWYFPGMDAGEALLIKLHDTDHTVAWRAPHTSFRDTPRPAPARASPSNCAPSPTSANPIRDTGWAAATVGTCY